MEQPEENPGINEFHPYFCAFCGEENQVFVDGTGGAHQKFTEDCEVCCRPNLISVSIGYDGSVWVDSEQEYEA